jgi:hypothetical protein
MNLEFFFQTIKSPKLIPSSEIPVFKELSDKYPFSQLFPIIYLKALSVNKDIRFDEELKNYAYRITDRAKLYDLIHNQNEDNYSFEEKSIVNLTEKKIEFSENKIIDIKRLQEEVIENPDVIKQKLNFNENSYEIVESKELEISDFAFELIIEKPKEDTLEKEILSNIISSSYSLEESEVLQSKKEKKSENDSSKLKVDLNQARSFSSWLKIGKSEQLPEERYQKKSVEIQKEKNSNSFIDNEIKIGKPKAEFFSAPKKAKESVNEERLIYSETLANIYALQGNFPKAIKAFEQLILTIPKKKLYFAQKIEELNKKINS